MFNFKTASKEALKQEYKRIAEESADDGFFTRKELKHLPETLMDEEQVLAFSSGMMDNNTWLIVLTDRRILFLDKGMFFGFKQAAIPINKINSISGKTGIFFGSIEIGDSSHIRRITEVSKKSVLRFVNKVQEVLDAAP